jgi:hypothetical protein
MSSIYRSQWEKEAREEIEYLLEKKAKYGWTQQDAERYEYLKKELKEDLDFCI